MPHMVADQAAPAPASCHHHSLSASLMLSSIPQSSPDRLGKHAPCYPRFLVFGGGRIGLAVEREQLRQFVPFRA